MLSMSMASITMPRRWGSRTSGERFGKFGRDGSALTHGGASEHPVSALEGLARAIALPEPRVR
jgi:hypothetical protein